MPASGGRSASARILLVDDDVSVSDAFSRTLRLEGFEVAQHLLEHARRNDLETPISSTFVAVSEGRMTPNDAIAALMERRVGTE